MAEATDGRGRADGVSKLRAVREAFQELGAQATVAQLQEHVRQRHGLEVQADLAANYRGKLLRQAGADVPPADETRTPADEAPPPAPAVGGKEAVREALRSEGKQASTARLQEVIRQRYGLDLSPGKINGYRSVLAREKAARRRPAAAREAAPEAAAAEQTPPAPPRAEAGTAAGNISLADIEMAQVLLARLGADQLRGLIDLLAR
jgi:hypothetical protein